MLIFFFGYILEWPLLKRQFQYVPPKNPGLNSTGSPCVMQKKGLLSGVMRLNNSLVWDLNHARYFLEFYAKLIILDNMIIKLVK